MNNGKRQNSILSMLALIVIALGVFAYWQQDLPGTTEKLDYSKLVKNINEDKIKEISLQRKDENYNVKGVLSDAGTNDSKFFSPSVKTSSLLPNNSFSLF